MANPSSPLSNRQPEPRQPSREGETLTIYFPVPQVLTCTEEGCSSAYSAASWTNKRQSVVRHLEQSHNVRIRNTTHCCSFCGDTLGLRPMGHSCLRGASSPGASLLRHACTQCSMSFPSKRGLVNHKQWHEREAAKRTQDLRSSTSHAPYSDSDQGSPSRHEGPRPVHDLSPSASTHESDHGSSTLRTT